MAEAAPSRRADAPEALPQDSTIAAISAASASLVESQSDSADMAVLERLEDSYLDTADSSNTPGLDRFSPGGASALEDAEVTYDIDVSTYGTHSRVQYYLDFFQTTARDRFTIWLQRMPRYEAMIRGDLRKYGVPEDMVYLALIESGFSNTAVSRSRATGMWQFMKGTGKLYGLRVDTWVDERRDPVRATDAAARHLADLRDQFGSMYLAAAAYNAGAGKVGRGLRRIGDDPDEEEDGPDAAFFRLYDTRYIRRETKDYVPKLIAAALIAKQPEKYGFPRVEGVPPLAYDSVIVPDATGLDVIARLADTTVGVIRELNPQFLRHVTPPKRESVVRLPPGTATIVWARFEAMPPRERVTFVEHTVLKGQTISGIAQSYRVSTQLVLDANPGVRPSALRPGSHLVIPTSYVPPSRETAAAPRGAERSPATASATIRYRVRTGESLWTISQDYHTTVARLRSLNGIGASESLRAGQVILVPAPAVHEASPPAGTTVAGGKLYTVRSGDTLSGIADRHRVSVSALRAANGLGRSSLIKPGQKLRIP
ncbi:MAG: LysM peptidoglycan-binding domain-containing protein [Gemmatimonadota bacterium]|nr:LysM peptidoglycan-binding domain-containing protein [Gemmatimonadota bacterium]MDH4347760.1 LysM peptidoglycan-binding domain-containing protein [Gemmatimonadota bacterium]